MTMRSTPAGACALGACILLTLAAGSAAAQTGHTPFDSAYHAWDRGDYVVALSTLQRVLRGDDAARWEEPIALLTGELFHTWDIAGDGRAPVWSPDGRHFAFEHGSGDARAIAVWIIGADQAPRRAFSVRGSSPAFSAAGELAYLRGEETAALRGARRELDALVAARDGAGARRQRETIAQLEATSARVIVRQIGSGRETERRSSGLARHALVFAADGTLVLLASEPGTGEAPVHAWALPATGSAVRLTDAAGVRGAARPFGAAAIIYAMDGNRFGVLDVAARSERIFAGTAPAAAADGRSVAYLRRDESGTALLLWRTGEAGDGSVVRATPLPLANPALSPTGARIAFQTMLRDDWEIFVVDADGRGELRVTHDIQHDLMPQFLSEDRLLAVMGEARHRRSHLYDITGTDVRGIERRRLFHNNTVRTVAPEYAWAPSPDGRRVLIVADRDGDTVSPERGVYLMALDRRVTRAELDARLDAALATERALRARGEAMYAPIAEAVRAAVADVAVGRIFEYAHALHQFDSKHITQPGNRLAIDYLAALLRSWGYDVELEWFEPRPGVRTANVVATLRGTAEPDLIYVVGSHFDSVERGPGADDNSSGTTALLEAARVLRDRPQPATIRFVLFTGEEAGLLGSREFARRALERGDRVLGALNNDMIGWTRSHRLDNTVRYSNRGIRDVQHAAAFLFTDLITYDSRYYQSTDAHALFDAFGDVIGGIGSYPILGNPHYHQAHDILETIDQRLVAEVSRATTAALMLLASSPARVAGLRIARRRGSVVDVAWSPSPESGVTGYEVVWRDAAGTQLGTRRVAEPRIALTDVPAGATVSVRALHRNGTHGWDWSEVGVAR
jgi:hypothetical protein